MLMNGGGCLLRARVVQPLQLTGTEECFFGLLPVAPRGNHHDPTGLEDAGHFLHVLSLSGTCSPDSRAQTMPKELSGKAMPKAPIT